MKDLTKIYIDLSKLSEEQVRILTQMTDGYVSEISEFPLLFWDEKEWNQTKKGDIFNIKGKTELTYSEFIKLFEGGEEVRTELLPDVAYWRYRCLLAEKCLSVSPCDPDITNEQINAHKSYNQFLETFGNKD